MKLFLLKHKLRRLRNNRIALSVEQLKYISQYQNTDSRVTIYYCLENLNAIQRKIARLDAETEAVRKELNYKK